MNKEDILDVLKKVLKAKSFWCTFVRWMLYGSLGVVLMLCEGGILPHLSYHGVSGTFLYCAVATIAFFEGKECAAVLGGVLGLFSSLLSGFTIIFLPLVLALVGYFCGKYSEILFRHRFITWLLTVLIACGSQAIVTLCCLCFGWLNFAPLAILGIVAVEAVLTFLLSLLLYLPVKGISLIRVGKSKY